MIADRESLDAIFDHAAELQGKAADRRDADPANEARRLLKMQRAEEQVAREIEDGIRDKNGNLVDEDLPDD